MRRDRANAERHAIAQAARTKRPVDDGYGTRWYPLDAYGRTIYGPTPDWQGHGSAPRGPRTMTAWQIINSGLGLIAAVVLALAAMVAAAP